MLATVENIFKNLSSSYRIKLVGGKKGLHNIANWVSVVEDDNMERFLCKNEIVFTAGLKNSYDSYLLNFAEKLSQVNCSALVINIGPYIKEVPQEVIQFCDNAGLPLYTLPWKMLMVDVVRDISHIIVYEETAASNISEAMQNIIFNTQDIETQINIVERYGFSSKSYYCPVLISVEIQKNETPYTIQKDLEIYCSKISHTIKDSCVSFLYNQYIVLIFMNYTESQISRFIQGFFENLSVKFTKRHIHICVGTNDSNILLLNKNFKRILPVINVAIKRNLSVVYYERIGTYQLLSEIHDYDLMNAFYYNTIGKLAEYDQKNDSSITEVLKSYITNNGNVSVVAQNLFLHRNTVNNQLKKAEQITEINPFTIEGKTQFLLGMKIIDYLDI